MALRVLLADNSETIKKVIQLTLQDYAAEVRSVNIGVDVLDVAKSFQPDIIFADILLQKRNGYEVCSDLKTSPDLSKIPVVLMWSGFMDLDKAKAQQARADATLEKPFDSNDLRQLIQKLVPKLSSQGIAPFLDVPKFQKTEVKLEPPTVPDAPFAAPKANTPPPPVVPPPPADAPAKWNMDSFEDINDFKISEVKTDLPDFPPNEGPEDFAQVPINKVALPKETAKKDAPKAAPPPETKKPVSQPASEFELDVPDETDFDGVTVNIVVPEGEITNTDFLLNPDPLTVSQPMAKIEPVIEKPAPDKVTPPKAQTPPQLSELELETLLQNQSREIIEKIVWKLVPDMAERIIREEIKRLLDEPDLKT